MTITRALAAGLTIAAATLITACGGSPEPSLPGLETEIDGAVLVLTDYGEDNASWSVKATSDGYQCPAAGGGYLVGEDGDHVELTRATEWSCTTLREGETGKVRLLTDSGDARGLREVVLLGSDGKVIAEWSIPQD